MRRSHSPEQTQVYFVLRESSDEASAIHRKPVIEQQRFWADRFRDAGWQAQRFIDGMQDAPFFYSQELVQVRTETWSTGRVALVGDAAHCASPYSGMGVSGGLVGAYVLAGGINQTPNDLPAALRRYDVTLRPFANEIQATVKPRILNLALPSSRGAIAAFQTVTRIACALRIPNLIARFSAEDRGGNWSLPDYPRAKSIAPMHY